MSNELPRIGVIFPCNEIGGDNGAVREYTQAVEELGFAHFEVFDHVVGQPGDYAGRLWREPFVLLAHLAALTSRIELATGIIILPQRQTALVAKQAAEVDLWSDGRLRLGLGVGWNPFEYAALDQDFSRRGKRMDGQIDALRTLWADNVVSVEVGNEVIVGGGMDPLPGRDIPIWIGGRSDAALKRAVTKSQGWLSNFQDHLANDRDDYLEARTKLEDAAGGSLPDGFGIEAWTSPGRTDPDTWAAEAAEWADLGVTHLSLRTDESRNNTMGGELGQPKTVAEHLALLTTYAEALGLT
ncbi:MAG: putative F420-dependent oxidoreductase [Acidimicrobiales bacterium]|jgi:probable F420-dependent oxidoreductase